MDWVSSIFDRAGARAAADTRGLALCVALVTMLFAAGASIARADDDLPGRVGRIAEFAGQPFLSAQDRPDDWTPVGINYPVTSGDNLWVSSDGHLEVDYGGGQFRLAGDTNVNVARLDDHQLTLFVARGRVIVRVRVLDVEDVARIDTPNTQIELSRPGLYRIEVAADGSTTKLGVREGEGFVALANGAQQVLPGQWVTASGLDPLTADMRNGSGSDGFDTWSANRDRYYERARAAPYVSRQMVGFVDLDQYGSWEDTPEYGAVWYPTAVAADWAPYDDGYWTNVGAWGLTWVDSAPWGFAPSHYGRWVHYRGRWGWCPGGYIARPRWAPALVGWYGGAGWGITANGGAPVYGWIPLGWGDAYMPWWRSCSQSCWNRYNKPFGVDPGDRANPRTRYSNIGVPGAMTAAPGATLVGRKPVRGSRVPVPPSQLSSAPLLATPPSVTGRSVAGLAFRPGERGTPTPASALYSNARRTVFAPSGTQSAIAEPAVSGVVRGQAATGARAAQSSDARVRAAPVLATPAQASLPAASVGGAREGPAHYGTVAVPAAAYTAQPAAPAHTARGAHAPTSVPPNAIALPPPNVTVPATGLALPPGRVALPATGIALPPAAPMLPSAPPAPVPAQAQAPIYVVPAGAPAGAPQQPQAPRGSADADGARSARTGTAPVGGAAPNGPVGGAAPVLR